MYSRDVLNKLQSLRLCIILIAECFSNKFPKKIDTTFQNLCCENITVSLNTFQKKKKKQKTVLLNTLTKKHKTKKLNNLI